LITSSLPGLLTPLFSLRFAPHSHLAVHHSLPKLYEDPFLFAEAHFPVHGCWLLDIGCCQPIFISGKVKL
jgi:hypothetical protein